MGSREYHWDQAMGLALMNDPDHWRSRAEEARCVAEEMVDKETARIMLGIAEGYDRLAQHAETQLIDATGLGRPEIGAVPTKPLGIRRPRRTARRAGSSINEKPRGSA